MQEELDQLYQARLSEFVSARNELATSLKKAGDAAGAKAVKALAKPSASAWAVNQLFWYERDIFDKLIAAGDRYRETVSTKGTDELAERVRRDAIEEATRRIRSILQDGGQSTTDVVMRRVATTLDALASYGSSNPEPMEGRLTRDLEPPGFAAFAALKPAAVTAGHPQPAQHDEIARAEEILAEREAALEGARRKLASAADRVATLRDRLAQSEKDAQDAESRIAEKEALFEQARIALEEARSKK